jgi:asparagine synthase (glutamine-hydrolysing)
VEAVTQLADAEVVDAFQALFDSSVDMHLRSDVSVGINLSSGVDSISLFYELKRLNKLKQLSIFSMGFAEPEFDETIEIAKLAAAEHVPFHRVEIRPEVQTRLADRVVEQLDQPFGGLSSIGYYELMTAPRAAGVKVLLEGQGVDELLGGYNYFLGPLYLDYLRNRDWSRVAAEIKRLAHGGGLFSLIRATRKLLGLARNVQRPVFQDGSEFLRLSCLKPEWVNWARQTPRPVFEQPFSGALANALYRDTRYTKLPRVLRFNDHLSMAFGIELRVPYLDHRLAELAFCLPNRWKIDRGFTKALLREAMKELVPDAIRLKQKRPQSSPQTTWYKGPLRDAVLDEIRSDRFRRLPMVDAQATERAFLRFVDDPKDQNSFFFWQLINLARWAERFAV